MVKFPLSDDDINNPTTWKEKGNDFFLKGHFEDAIKCYARAIEIDPDYFDAWNNLGLALIKLGKIDEAKKCNDKVKELKLKNKESFIPDTSQNVVSKEDFYPTSPPEKEGFPHPSTNLPVIQTEKEKEVTSSSNIEDEEREYCRNCGEELPYKQGEWPQSLPKICPSCGVRVKDPIRYGSREGQGRTHVEKLKNPLLAALLSIIPGLGQAYNGQILRGLLFFFATGIGLLLLVFPGIIVWIFGIYDSYRTAKKMNYGDIPFKNTSVKLIVGYILLLLILSGVAAAGYSYFTNPSKSLERYTVKSPQSNSLSLDQIAAVSLVIHDHWTESDMNDGKIVYIDFINKQNVALGKTTIPDVQNIKVRLRILGYDISTKDYTIQLFDKTYSNLNYYDIYYMQGNAIVINYNEIKKYENQCCTGITAEVTLPDGRILKTHEIHDLNINPTVVK